MLHEIREKRHEMITHVNTDDLRGTLGFEEPSPGRGGTAPDGDVHEPPDARGPGGHP